MPESRAPERRGFDLLGAFSVTAGLIVLVYAIVKVQAYGWTSAGRSDCSPSPLALLAAFVVTELRTRHPLVRLDIFRTRSLTAANVVMLAVGGGMFAIFFFATLYVQEILHLSPVQAGLGFLPLTAAIIVASGIAQQLIGPRISVIPRRARRHGDGVARTDPALAGLGRRLLPARRAARHPRDGTRPRVHVRAADPDRHDQRRRSDDAGLASGLFNTSQQVGGALGLAVLSTIAANRTADRLTSLGHKASAHQQAQALVSGFHVGFLAGAGLMALGVALIAILVRARHVAAISGAEPAIATG